MDTGILNPIICTQEILASPPRSRLLVTVVWIPPPPAQIGRSESVYDLMGQPDLLKQLSLSPCEG